MILDYEITKLQALDGITSYQKGVVKYKTTKRIELFFITSLE